MLFPAQVAFYGSFVSDGAISGLNWIQSHTKQNSLLLVAPVNGVPFGWWVEGYARRASLTAAANEWLNVPTERARSLEAVRLLTASDVLDNSSLTADRRAGIDWIVLPSAWGGVTPAQVRAFEVSHREATVYHSTALTVIEVPR
jgi:hypothetical protein